ncbi:unnamed protein product [Closterium sp. Yama58-4]|nr:unnamed protein product [Closterium sp. Yama58-4]
MMKHATALPLGALLLLACYSVSRVECVPLVKSQAQVLLDCQKAWSKTFDGWVVGGDCSKASSVTCDSQGMITEIYIVDESLNGTIPDSISNLQSLSHL